MGCQGLLPCIFIVLNGHQSILHCFVDQGVDTGHEEADSTEQSLAILTQKLLCFGIIPKLVLQRKKEKVLPANLISMSRKKWELRGQKGQRGNIIPATLGTSG